MVRTRVVPWRRSSFWVKGLGTQSRVGRRNEGAGDQKVKSLDHHFKEKTPHVAQLLEIFKSSRHFLTPSLTLPVSTSTLHLEMSKPRPGTHKTTQLSPPGQGRGPGLSSPRARPSPATPADPMHN